MRKLVCLAVAASAAAIAFAAPAQACSSNDIPACVERAKKTVEDLLP